jgi:preprotein translocase subunit YajC
MYDIDLQKMTLTLGQDAPPPGAGAVPPQPGGGEPVTGTSGAPGTPGGQPAGRDPFGGMFFPLLLLLLVTMIMFTVLGQRRDRKKRQALIGSVKKHDKVQTVGGVIGSIVEVKPDTVVLKVDENSNTRITFARSAIQQVLTSGPESGATESPTGRLPS